MKSLTQLNKNNNNLIEALTIPQKMLIDTIQSAIHEKKELLLKIKSGDESETSLEVFMQPYVLGNDVLQYSFVWGFLSHNGLFYKVLTDWIISAETIEIPYTVQEGVVYEQSPGEEHICVLEGLPIHFTDAGTFV